MGTVLPAEDNSQVVGAAVSALTANTPDAGVRESRQGPTHHVVPQHCLPESGSIPRCSPTPEKPEFNSRLVPTTSVFSLSLVS